MGVLLNVVKWIQNKKYFNNKVYELNNTCEDKYCMCGSINIFKTNEPNIYTISIECSEIFPSKEKLYEYYLTLYNSFYEHFKEVISIKDILVHEHTYEGEKVTLLKHGDHYGINEVLMFNGTMVDCRDWFYGTLQNLYTECFN